MELDSHSWKYCHVAELFKRWSWTLTAEVLSCCRVVQEVELDSHSWKYCHVAELFKRWSWTLTAASIVMLPSCSRGGAGLSQLPVLSCCRVVQEVELDSHSCQYCHVAELFKRWSWTLTAASIVMLPSCSRGGAGLSQLEVLSCCRVVPQQLSFGLRHCDCSARLLKEQVAEYTGCFALAGVPTSLTLVLVVTDGLFGSERRGELFICTREVQRGFKQVERRTLNGFNK